MFLWVLAFSASVAPAVAEAPTGPRLAVVRATAKSNGLELATVDSNGAHPVRLAGGGRRRRPFLNLFSPMTWSADGKQIAFSGIVGFRNGDGAEPIQKLFFVNADGSGLRAIPGTEDGAGPALSPDGHTVAFTRTIQSTSPVRVGGKQWDEGFDGSSIWTVDLLTGVRRQLTPWRSGLWFTASSFAPNGSTLLATVEDELVSDHQPVVLTLDGRIVKRIFDDGFSPVYSPDGTKVALIRRVDEYTKEQGENTDLYVINSDGTDLRRLTRTPGRPELSPSWDPSGQRLTYIRLPLARSEDAIFGNSNALMEINADGTCARRVQTPRLSLYFSVAWQPGPGRGMGRIEC
jgi:dipeptidyl aminopeptidase/acylaminoacyl peptidase